MCARIPRHQNISVNDLGEAVDGADCFSLFHPILSILHALTMFMNRKVILPRLDKNFICLQDPSWIDDSNEHTRVWQQNPGLLSQIHKLVELHAVKNGRQHWILHNINSFDKGLFQSGLE